jgi:hypothetical protein
MRMRKEYALEGQGFFKHWSDAYPTLALARVAARRLVQEGANREVHILQRIPIPLGHEFGARWERVAGLKTDLNRTIVKDQP